jgi:hypothetical protein
MDPDVISFAGVMLTIVASVAGVAIIFVGVKLALASGKRHALAPSKLDDSRLEQLQQSIDAIAVEVERISEGQRFSTKLLAAREADPRRHADSGD